jgi:hypothetical protein
MFKLVIIGLAVALTKQQSFFGRLKQGQSLFNSKKSPPPSLPQSFEFEYYEVTTITYGPLLPAPKDDQLHRRGQD